MAMRVAYGFALVLLTVACLPPDQSDPAGAEDETGDEVPTTTQDPITTGDPGFFVPEPDFQPPISCDPFLQDCEPGEKCVPYGSSGGNWDANKCVPVLGDGAPGDPCTYDGVAEGTDSCDATSLCWDFADVGDGLVGRCTPFCAGTPDTPTCPSGSACAVSCAGTLTVCIQNCNPLEQDCLGRACYWAGSGFNCFFTSPGIPEGEPCGYINDCAPGLMCAAADVMPDCQGSACCAAFCDLTAPNCGLTGTACVAFFEQGMAPPGYENVGVCIVPDA